MSIQKQLISFAFEKAYPYIIEQPTIKDFLSQISFILVGSAATGLCSAESDVDICLICDQNTYDTISVGTRWLDGRPTEVILDGIQLHYYAISTESLNRKIAELDGLTFYVYGNVVVIDDATGQYKQIADKIHDPSLLPQRFGNELEMLRRRKRALHYVLNSDIDPMARLEICTEIIKRLLICIALYDGREYDSRKRLYCTALLGTTGNLLQSKIDKMISLLGTACKTENTMAATEFLELFDYCFDYIS
jgi:hypothetical protein